MWILRGYLVCVAQVPQTIAMCVQGRYQDEESPQADSTDSKSLADEPDASYPQMETESDRLDIKITGGATNITPQTLEVSFSSCERLH